MATSQAYYYPTYDGNGNVSEYLDGSGVSQAHYAYDGFGNLAITPPGSKAGDFAQRFSTKFRDEESALDVGDNTANSTPTNQIGITSTLGATSFSVTATTPSPEKAFYLFEAIHVP
ncbi:MAG: hypothetical protein QNL33_00135 [Akkermansiaceae bacterium]